MKKCIIPIIFSSEGWKGDWVLSNQKSNEITKNLINKDEVKDIIEKHLKRINEEVNEANIEVELTGAFLDNSKEYQEEILQEITKFKDNEKISEITVLAKPQYINRATIKRLKKYKVNTVELQVLSTSEYLLNKLGEKYRVKDIKKASKCIKWHRIKLGYQIMVGLPESTRIDEINTVKALVELKPKIVNINPVIVLKNTDLEKAVEENKYKPLTVVQTIEICKELVEILNKANIENINIGFQPIDNSIEQVDFSSKIFAGPIHHEFRQLVESSLWYDSIVNKIKKINNKVMEVEVTVNPQDFDNVIGYQKENIQKLKEIYDIDLSVNPKEEIKPGKSKIEITKTYSGFKE